MSGASVDLSYDTSKKSPLHVSLLQNSSHLEAANPTALGLARARQMTLLEDSREEENKDCFLGDKVMCVQMHGDAAFTGQVSLFSPV